MLQSLLVCMWKALSYIGARCLYSPVSKLYRLIFERKYKNLPSDIPWVASRVLRFFETCTWKQDPMGGLIDVISKPEKFYATKTGDCDDFAAFACRVLCWPSFIISVTWFDPKAKWFKKFQGHNVCAYYYKERWWHISNWGRMGPLDRPRDIWKNVPPPGTIPCAYSIRKDDLKWFDGGIIKKE